MFLSQQQRRVAAAAIAGAIVLVLVVLTGGPKPTPPARPGQPLERTLDVSAMVAVGELKTRDWSTTSPGPWVRVIRIADRIPSGEDVPRDKLNELARGWARANSALVLSDTELSVPAGKELLLGIGRVRVPRRPTIWTRLLRTLGIKPDDRVSIDLSFLRDLEPGDLQGLAVDTRSDASSVERTWYRRNIGPLRWLTKLDLSYNHLGDWPLRFLGNMTSLEDLDLGRNGLHDNDLAHLARLTSLRRLILAGNPIDGHGLARLHDLNSLEVLDVSFTNINDAGAVRLENSASLRKLDLSFTKLSDSGLLSIGKLTSLVDLDLCMSAVEGPGLVRLKNLRSLKRLALWTIDDPDDLAALADLPSLEELELGIPNPTEKHAAVLKTFPSLRKLRLIVTYDSYSARMKLKEALPDCEVTW